MTNLSFKNLISASQLTHEDITLLINTALPFKNNSNTNTIQNTPILATLFFEPSTRTRFSFETAILKLNGNYISLESGLTSSIAKGESLEDMGKIISYYADIVAIRHPEINSAKRFSSQSSIPVINAGDGSNEHPTQTITDLITIFEHKHRLDNLNIAFYGDLNNGRTSNSLIRVLSTYNNNNFHFISPENLGISNEIKTILKSHNQTYTEYQSLNNFNTDVDILYVTRIQTERIDKVINPLPPLSIDTLPPLNKASLIMHPLPRITEIDKEIDKLDQATYFKQAENGLYARMALLSLLLKQS